MTLTQRSPLYLPESNLEIQPSVSLAEMTTYRVGGPAEWFTAPHTAEQLRSGVIWAVQRGLPITILGAGSNLLVSDLGLPGLVIATRYLRSQSLDEPSGQVTVAAGNSLPKLCWQLAKKGWAGLEWAVGVPGTVGGAVVMNAGAHGACVADSLVSAQVLDVTGQVETLSQSDLSYSYRSSVLQGSQKTVLSATFQLTADRDPALVQKDTQHHLDHRLNTQPYSMPSCGSVFRNPLPQKAGWLIENAGLKGYQLGGAQVSEKHANFIVNCDHATAHDIYALIALVQAKIEAQWDIKLHPEVKMLGKF